jgi:hypothetical protein
VDEYGDTDRRIPATTVLAGIGAVLAADRLLDAGMTLAVLAVVLFLLSAHVVSLHRQTA